MVEYAEGVNQFVSTLGPADRNLIRPYLSELRFERGRVLVRPGERLDAVYFPTSAVLSVVTQMANGQMVESCAIGRETAYGLLNALGSNRVRHRVAVQIPGHGYQAPAARVREVAAASPTLTEQIIRHVQAVSAQTEQSVACNALHDVGARLCRWLLLCQDRVGLRDLPLTQEFLGQMLGVQRTTVTAAAGALQAAGLIRYRRGMIDIVDRLGLEAGACECYAAVQQDR